jgi:hypothetical protein
MLVCQLMVWVLAAVKRFDTVVLHAWQSAREALRSALSFGADREADLG